MYKVVIIDDNNDFSFALQCFLRSYFQVVTFTEVKDFIKEVKSQQYDLALIDFTILPDKIEKIANGCQLIEYLKSNLLEPPILVILTGWISKNDLESGKEICPHADGFLAKDVGVESIINYINDMIKIRKNDD